MLGWIDKDKEVKRIVWMDKKTRMGRRKGLVGRQRWGYERDSLDGWIGR